MPFLGIHLFCNVKYNYISQTNNLELFHPYTKLSPNFQPNFSKRYYT